MQTLVPNSFGQRRGLLGHLPRLSSKCGHLRSHEKRRAVSQGIEALKQWQPGTEHCLTVLDTLHLFFLFYFSLLYPLSFLHIIIWGNHWPGGSSGPLSYGLRSYRSRNCIPEVWGGGWGGGAGGREIPLTEWRVSLLQCRFTTHTASEA